VFLESIIALIALAIVISLLLGVLKLVFGLVLLPLKLGLLLTQGLITLVLGLPLLLIVGLLLGAVLPIALIAFVIPVWVLGAVVCFFLG
jgi:hypothetical protein